MSIRHLPGLDHERWYIIDVDRSDSAEAPWRQRLLSLHGPNSQASIEWSVFGRGFGWGFELGRNGGESDLGLNLYAGRLASVWMRLRAPWTRWARVTKEQDPKDWYHPRHTGIRVHPWDGCLIEAKVEDRDGTWTKGQPWWQDMKITTTTLFGRNRTVETIGGSGMTNVPLPEGNYAARWTERQYVNYYTRPLGRLRDRIWGPRRHSLVDLDIAGGIPVEGKGENSWDCGMDGVFGCSGRTVQDAVGNAVKSVLRDRERYGGPHDLDQPMTVQEAEKRHA